jgi:hypothetical protein
MNLSNNVCCICTKSVFQKLSLRWVIFWLTLALSFTSGLINAISTNSTLLTIGLVLHIVSISTAFLLSSFFGRYLSGPVDSIHHHGIFGYFLVPMYWFFTILFMIKPVEHSYLILLYFLSSTLLWYNILVFKPIIGIQTDKPGTFVNFIIYRLFYEDMIDTNKYHILSSISLIVTFCVSTLIMNMSYVMYHQDYVLVVSATIFTIVPVLLQCLIFLAAYVGRNTLGHDLMGEFECIAFWWTGVLILWQIIIFINVLIFWPQYLFVQLQLIPSAVALLFGICISLYKLYQCSCFHWCQRELDAARNQVVGFDPLIEL